MQTHSQKFLRQRKFLMVLPFLVLPFITMIFWSLGGGKAGAAEAQTANTNKGLNTKLPDAHISENKGTDKLSFYQQADKDSVLLQQQMLNDPYYKDVPESEKQMMQEQTKQHHSLLMNNKSSVNANEEKVNEKLQQLQTIINQPQQQPQMSLTSAKEQNNNPDINRLEKMMQNMNNDNNDDKEMQQLSGVMDKILDLQHPERMDEKLKEQLLKNKQQVFVVSLNDTVKHAKGFYSLEDNGSSEVNQNTIEAIVPETQTLVGAATVKLLLANDIYINGVLIPRNSFVYGTATLSNERLRINVASLRYKNNIIPVALEVYDIDGLQGIYIPGSINRDVAKESSNEAINALGLTTLDPSLAAQATGAGIQAAKTLLSKKVKQIKVTIKEGYKILLKDNNQKL
ncbi:hypothetical protein GALL_165650 [mine drainage metagenome]|uniref:Conjugative transposon TraM C-terminal domain-containing protein n=1 Tax=mine drainage metagenome TaxID=410659 RepID=A0A1J5SAR0_9ZZZZ